MTDPIQDSLKPQITIGYFGGTDPYICVLETVWPDKFQPPIYICRMSRREGYETLQDMFQDRRIVTDLDHPPAVLAATDEIEAELVESIGYSLNWVRPVNGPGAVNDDQARACLNIPVAELETVLRTLATSQRLRFPASLGVLGRRAGGEMSLEDRELVALGLAVWYSYQRDDAIRHQVPKLQRMGERFDTQQQVPWETGETAESELDALISLVRNNQ